MTQSRDHGSETPWERILQLLLIPNSAYASQAMDLAECHLSEGEYRVLLRSLCTSSDPLVRDDAVGRLQDWGDESDEYRLLLMSKDSDWVVRATVASTMSQFKTVPLRDRLYKMACKDKSPIVRTWSIAGLLRQGMLPNSSQVLCELLKTERHPDPRMMLLTESLRLGVIDIDVHLRHEVLQALNRNTASANQAVARFVQCIADEPSEFLGQFYPLLSYLLLLAKDKKSCPWNDENIDRALKVFM